MNSSKAQIEYTGNDKQACWIPVWFGVAQGDFRILVSLFLYAAVLVTSGCASTPVQPISEFEQSVYRDAPGKGSVVIYRSIAESAVNKSVTADIYIDKQPFIGMKGGEYVPIFLPEGEHDIEIRFHRPCENIHGWKKTINFQS